MKRSLHSLMFAVTIAVSGLLLTTGCEKEAPPEKPKTVIRPVRFVRAAAREATVRRVFSGVSRAGVESRLSFKVPGTVRAVHVKVGDKVKKDDPIAELDPTDYRLRVREAEAGLERARAETRNAEATFERIRALYENRNASRNDLDAARAAAESGRAAVVSIENQLALARRQLGYTRLMAADDCAVAGVPVEASENVQAGQPVAVMSCGDRLEVTVAVPEGYISSVREGEPVRVRFDAFPEEDYEARVLEVGIMSLGMETTFPVTVRLDGAPPRLRPGMAAEVAFSGDDRQPGGVLAPASSVGEDAKGRFVFIVTPGEKGFGEVHRRDVTIGKLTPEGMVLFSGVSAGEFVVTAGVSRITDGLTVRFSPDKEGSLF